MFNINKCCTIYPMYTTKCKVNVVFNEGQFYTTKFTSMFLFTYGTYEFHVISSVYI